MPAPDHLLPNLPADLPWQAPAYLLLDGVSLEELPRRLYECYTHPDFEPLYLNTPLAELRDISPCLVSLNGVSDPGIATFLNTSQEESGYLIFSNADRPALLQHLRWLISVEHPLEGSVLLRLADPAVMNALLTQAVSENNRTLFGPIERVVLPDHIECCWHQHVRPEGESSANHDKPYPLSEIQLSLLDDVSFRSVVIGLHAHLAEYFPTYRADLVGTGRWQHVSDIAAKAYRQGFNTELDITRYANIFGLLGDDALEHHPDIASLLSQSSALTHSQRVEQAAEMAYIRTETRDGMPA